ncbi:MAG: exo-alpha-sialidase [Oscillospiraceae bacterium]|nr:exo-alpha-sialidase [Oscillospiraceae bacterium]
MITSKFKEFIFAPGTIAESCHASTVLPLDDGSVLAAWFAGEHEKADDVRIWVSKRRDGEWSYPVAVPSDKNVAHWNPVLDLRNDGTVCLYYKKGKTTPSWRTWFVLSKDNGVTWAQPQILVPGDKIDGRGPVKNKCIRLSNGALLAPASTEQRFQWRAFIDISYDDGATWQKQKNITRPRITDGIVGMIQPTLWESPPGSVHALIRSSGSRIYRSDSSDYGLTWGRAYATALPNNNSGIDCVKDDGGRVWLLYNPVEKNWGGRSPLTLAVTKDNGETWENVLDLETREGGEFSYPAITYMDGRLHMTYTYDRKQVAYWEIGL